MSKKVNQRLFRPLLNTENIEQQVLPEVTDADDGKVLTVVDGEWDKADASGGGDTGKFVGYGEVQAASNIEIPANGGVYFNQTNINVIYLTFSGAQYTPNAKTKIIPYENNNAFGGYPIVINSMSFRATQGGIFGYIMNAGSSANKISSGKGFIAFYIFETP